MIFVARLHGKDKNSLSFEVLEGRAKVSSYWNHPFLYKCKTFCKNHWARINTDSHNHFFLEVASCVSQHFFLILFWYSLCPPEFFLHILICCMCWILMAHPCLNTKPFIFQSHRCLHSTSILCRILQTKFRNVTSHNFSHFPYRLLIL